MIYDIYIYGNGNAQLMKNVYYDITVHYPGMIYNIS